VAVGTMKRTNVLELPLRYLLVFRELVTHETLAVGIIGVGLAAFVYLAITAAKRKIVAEFERGMANHYLCQQTSLESKRELLVFTPGQVGSSQVLFLAIVWILGKADPKVSLNEIRFPQVGNRNL